MYHIDDVFVHLYWGFPLIYLFIMSNTSSLTYTQHKSMQQASDDTGAVPSPSCTLNLEDFLECQNHYMLINEDRKCLICGKFAGLHPKRQQQGINDIELKSLKKIKIRFCLLVDFMF
jgi:hypothetical protein